MPGIADQVPIARTHDGWPIYPAVQVAPGMSQPLGVLVDGSPVWPVDQVAVPAGQLVPFGQTSDGAPVWAKSVSVRSKWRRKRVLFPAALLVLLLVLTGIGNLGSGPAVATHAASSSVDWKAEGQVDPAKAAADKAAVEKAAVEKAAAEKAAADKAAAEKAAADKAAAEKAAADKAAAQKAAAEKAAADKAAAETAGQQNAREAAADYLSYTAFSRSGLIAQLKFEGYSTQDATYGVDSLNANWNTQAAKDAQTYLDMTAFSRSGLIEQLMFEGYTRTQATYGVNKAGL